MFEELYRAKHEKYNKYGINETGYVLKTKPTARQQIGFFDPFVGVAEFRDQVLSPIMIPLVSSSLAVTALFRTAMNFTSGLLRFCLGDFSQGGKELKKSIGNFVATFYFAITGIVDTLREAVSLITRSLATLVDKGMKLAKRERAESGSVEGRWTKRQAGYESSEYPAVAAAGYESSEYRSPAPVYPSR